MHEHPPEVDVTEGERLVRHGARVLDVREPDEWDAGHIPGATHVPLGALAAHAAEVSREDTWVVVCRSGARSLSAVDALRRAGYRAVNLHGGMRAWERAGLAMEAEGGAEPVVL